MRLILDTNEYVLGLDRTSGAASSIKLLHEILPRFVQEVEDFCLFAPDVIRDEVREHMPRHLWDNFYSLITSDPKIDYGWLYEVPLSLLEKYIGKGLKSADAIVAAFTDWLGVDFLVSSDRYLCERLKDNEAFVTCTADEFVQLVESGQVWTALAELRARREGLSEVSPCP